MTLLCARPGVRYVVLSVLDGCPVSAGDLGIVPGAEISLTARFPLGGPLLVSLDGSMVALARRVASRIIIRQS